MKALLFLSFLILSLSTAFAEELKHSGHSIFIDNKAHWEVARDLFGIPFILFSPGKNGQRSNISFAHTGVDLELEVSALKENQRDYQLGKEKWAQTHQALIKRFIPYESHLNSLNHRFHSIGVIYESEKRIYQEMSFYIECKGQIVFSKGLGLIENIEDQNYFKELINSLDCGAL